MTEAGLSTIVGACSEPVESHRPISAASLTITIDYTATYTDVRRTVTMFASSTRTWSKVPFPGAVLARANAPGGGLFYFAQANCCCPCRTIFIADDAILDTFGEFGGEASDLDFDLVITTTPDGEDPTIETREVSTFFQFWPLLSPPCKKADGFQSAQICEVLIPQDPLSTDDLGAVPLISVTGSYNPTVDTTGEDPATGYVRFLFTTPDPCNDNQDFQMTIVYSWSTDIVEATATVFFDFTLS